VKYANFCRLIQKGAVLTLAISGVTGPILIKLNVTKLHHVQISFAHDVAIILNIFESELPYSYLFWNTKRQMKVILPILPKIGCHGNVP